MEYFGLIKEILKEKFCSMFQHFDVSEDFGDWYAKIRENMNKVNKRDIAENGMIQDEGT